MSVLNKKPYAQKVIESLGQADLEALASAINGGGNSAFGFSFDLIKTSPDGNVWKLDWSIDNNGNITWSPVKLTT